MWINVGGGRILGAISVKNVQRFRLFRQLIKEAKHTNQVNVTHRASSGHILRSRLAEVFEAVYILLIALIIIRRLVVASSLRILYPEKRQGLSVHETETCRRVAKMLPALVCWDARLVERGEMRLI